MRNILLITRSITHAQRVQRTLALAGLPSQIRRGPQELTTGGCGYAVVIRESDLQTAAAALRAAGLWPMPVYLAGKDFYREVRL